MSIDKETRLKWASDVDRILDTEGKDGLERHANVSKRNNHYCNSCFCCYCLDILNNLNGTDEAQS
jgi:hypothetical protein